MPIVLKAIDLEEVFDDDEFLLAWVGKSIEEGRSFGGYSGNIYSHKKYVNAEIYSCFVVNEEDKKLELEKFDIQISGACVWKVRYSDIPLKNDISYNMTRLSAVKNSERNGFTIMHLINADVLPSFLEDDEI